MTSKRLQHLEKVLQDFFESKGCFAPSCSFYNDPIVGDPKSITVIKISYTIQAPSTQIPMIIDAIKKKTSLNYGKTISFMPKGADTPTPCLLMLMPSNKDDNPYYQPDKGGEFCLWLKLWEPIKID
jgi:hypothetical protein